MDGIGMTAEKLKAIRNDLENDVIPETQHFGILNVHQRIRLVYGSKYGINISSDENGTVVRLLLPAVPFSKVIL